MPKPHLTIKLRLQSVKCFLLKVKIRTF